MIANFIKLNEQKAELVELSGNFNYGLFCGKKDTIERGSDFLYDSAAGKPTSLDVG